MALHFSVDEFKKFGKVVKQNEVYTVIDVPVLKNLVVSMTILHPGKETSGHSHGEADEVYFFLEGRGKIQVDHDNYVVSEGSVILIPRGAFHKVFNKSEAELKFMCVFEKYGERV